MESSARIKDKKYDLEDRLVCFAALIGKFCQGLPDDNTGQYYARQLMRSGGSAALNFGEAQGTFTNKDYVHKVSLSLKELKESRVTLKIMNFVDYGDDNLTRQLLKETEELIRIIATIIKNKSRKSH